MRQRITERADGTRVIETVADYQSYEEDGTRDALYTRLYQFDLDSGKVAANAYSPRLQSFEPWKNDPRDLGYTPESDEFVYDADLQYDKQVTTSGIAAFGAPVELGSAQLADGTAAAFAWNRARSTSGTHARNETPPPPAAPTRATPTSACSPRPQRRRRPRRRLRLKP